ncbi:MAG: hypothetical protein WAZ77_20060, partial [Candidatus Nitrosopolaris sp.]
MPKKDKIVFEDKQRRIGKRTGIGPSQCENKRCKRDAIYFVTLKQDLPTLPLSVCSKHSKTITIDDVVGGENKRVIRKVTNEVFR